MIITVDILFTGSIIRKNIILQELQDGKDDFKFTAPV